MINSRFSATDPFMFDWIEVWRFQNTGSIEGEPQMARTMVTKIKGRVDDMQSRHTDSSFRTNITNVHQDYGCIFLPVGANVQSTDVLRANGQDYQIISINTAPGAFANHHLEVFVDRVEGAA